MLIRRGASGASRKRGERISRWLVFSVVIALVPLCFEYLNRLLDGAAPSLAKVVADGELMLISSAISAAAVGELIPSGRERPIRKVLAGGGCIVVVLFASLCFATLQTRAAPDPRLVLTVSSWLFGGTILVSGMTVYFAWEETG